MVHFGAQVHGTVALVGAPLVADGNVVEAVHGAYERTHECHLSRPRWTHDRERLVACRFELIFLVGWHVVGDHDHRGRSRCSGHSVVAPTLFELACSITTIPQSNRIESNQIKSNQLIKKDGGLLGAPAAQRTIVVAHEHPRGSDLGCILANQLVHGQRVLAGTERHQYVRLLGSSLIAHQHRVLVAR